MTSEQSKKAELLNRKITHHEEILKSLQKSNVISEGQNHSFTLVKLTCHSKDAIAYEVVIDPEWFHSPELRSDLGHCAKIAREGFTELLEKDLELMKEELSSVFNT